MCSAFSLNLSLVLRPVENPLYSGIGVVLTDGERVQSLGNDRRINLNLFCSLYSVSLCCLWFYIYSYWFQKDLAIHKQTVKVIIILSPKDNIWTVECISLQHFPTDSSLTDTLSSLSIIKGNS